MTLTLAFNFHRTSVPTDLGLHEETRFLRDAEATWGHDTFDDALFNLAPRIYDAAYNAIPPR